MLLKYQIWLLWIFFRLSFLQKQPDKSIDVRFYLNIKQPGSGKAALTT